MKNKEELAYSRALVVRKKKRIIKIFVLLIIFFVILTLITNLPKISNKPIKQEESGEANILDDLNFMGIEIEREIGKDQMEIDYINNCTCTLSYPEIGIEEVDDEIKRIAMSLKDDFLMTFSKVPESGEKLEKYSQHVTYETYLAPENIMSLALIEAQVVNDSNVMCEKVYTYLFDLETGMIIKETEIYKIGYEKKITEYLTNLFQKDEKYKENVFKNITELLNDIEKSGYNIILKNDSIAIYFDKYEIMPGSFGTPIMEIPYKELNEYLLIDEENQTLPPTNNSGNNNENNNENNGEITGDDKASTEMASGDKIKKLRYATATVNIREQPSSGSKKLGVLGEGDEIEIIEQNDDWTKVNYNGVEAYIKSDYLARKKLEHREVELVIKDRGIDPSKPMVALTYDDGPNPISTPRILDTLEKYNAVATFFDLGQLVNSYPEIVKREEALNCEVGNHTYSHANLNLLSEDDLIEEIIKSEKAFENALGHKTTLLRPSYGNANGLVKEIVDYPLITWNVDSLDWKTRNKDKILAQIRKEKDFDGKIILMHSIYASTADATEVLVPELIEKGYQLVTVSELAYYKGKKLETGKVYTNF